MTEVAVASRIKSIHPFPARMAPELALDKIQSLTNAGDVVLDPMCGSGTVVATAQSNHRRPLACDLDPLAVMITRTVCNPSRSLNLRRRAEALIKRASTYSSELPPWIASDQESKSFVEFWFDEPQRRALSRLARALDGHGVADDALRVALSRLIITKEGGASLARDTSHSRPHKVRDSNKFDVDFELVRSADRIETLMKAMPGGTKASVRLSDARHLSAVSRSSVNLIVTSPPYLNAIDYLRGHRMSLIWFGYGLSALRETRGTSIGTERGQRPNGEATWMADIITGATSGSDAPSNRYRMMISRYVSDMHKMSRSAARVLKPGGHLVFVVANSQTRDTKVNNAHICRQVAERNGLIHVSSDTRGIPAQHRYLPPPSTHAGSTMDARMKMEYVITLRKSDTEPDVDLV